MMPECVEQAVQCDVGQEAGVLDSSLFLINHRNGSYCLQQFPTLGGNTE